MSTTPSVLRRTVVPLLLMIACPPAVIVLWMITAHFDGSLELFLRTIDLPTFLRLFPRPTRTAALMLATFAALEWALLVMVPGDIHPGPITPAGNRPRYRRNGMSAYAVTHVLLATAALLGSFRLSAVYDELGSILVITNIAGLVLCGLLYWKGVHRPSSTDAGRSGNLIFDYFWGVELHPTAFGVQLKQYVNCRLAMMGWSVIVLSCVAKQYEIHGHVSLAMWVSAGLQIAYIIKFFWWETGYFGSLDIMHDRFGFYIVWGVMAWLPCLYTMVAQYLVRHPGHLGVPAALAIFTFGIIALFANYDADAQRQRVRETLGETTVWGRKPEIVVATYHTADGEARESLLLCSGWWGVARHFHYVAEISLALAWTLPAGFSELLPYGYVAFLTALLVDRAGRDDRRCRAKYGEAWDRYCERVPYRIVPFVY
ncbi:Delta(24(24(1)))-sterol reductase [Minicystis rosea]|nr:Delta(24(24(1)))-sterol reductase [Minicystis rosea]